MYAETELVAENAQLKRRLASLESEVHGLRVKNDELKVEGYDPHYNVYMPHLNYYSERFRNELIALVLRDFVALMEEGKEQEAIALKERFVVKLQTEWIEDEDEESERDGFYYVCYDPFYGFENRVEPDKNGHAEKNIFVFLSEEDKYKRIPRVVNSILGIPYIGRYEPSFEECNCIIELLDMLVPHFEDLLEVRRIMTRYKNWFYTQECILDIIEENGGYTTWAQLEEKLDELLKSEIKDAVRGSNYVTVDTSTKPHRIVAVAKETVEEMAEV